MEPESRFRPWHLYLAAAWVIFLSVWFLLATKSLVESNRVPRSADLAVWSALVIVQAMIWGVVAYVNLGINHSLDRRNVGPVGAVIFVAAAFVAVVLPIAATAIVGVNVIGGTHSTFVGGVILLAGFISAIPAVLVIYYGRAIAVVDEWHVDADSVRRLRHLRRSVRAATASLGAVIAVAIAVASYVLEDMAEVSEAVVLQSGHLLIYGGFFTLFVFALYYYGKSGVDRRAEMMVDQAIPVLGLTPPEGFFENEDARQGLRTALGLDRSAREGFENLVIVASPLLSAILTDVIGQ